MTQARTFNFRGAIAFASAALAAQLVRQARYAEGKTPGDGRNAARCSSNGGIKVRRAARKARNRAAHRKACRG